MMASDARRQACAETPDRSTSSRIAYRVTMPTRVGRASASHIACWCSTLMARRPNMKQMSRSNSSTELRFGKD